jgi:hypothetical protein
MLEGKPSKQDEATTMRAIKGILSDCDVQTRPSKAVKRPKLRLVEDDLTLTPVKDVEDKLRPAKFTTVPAGHVPDKKVEVLRRAEKTAAEAPAPSKQNLEKARRAKAPTKRKIALTRLSAPKVLGRIKPRWLALGILLYCAMAYPILIVAPFFAVLTLVLGAFAIFGADRVWHDVGQLFSRYEARNPKKATRLLKRLDAFAIHWDAFLDRFPEGWVDGLYLPDLADREERLRREEAILDARLERMHRQV